MAYSFDQVFAADPANPANIAQNAAITIYAPGDVTMTPLTLTDPSGGALTNPIQVNANGFGPAFQHATLDRVAWSGGGFTGFLTSYEGMKQEAIDARAAAETAAATAGADAAAVADAAIGDATAEAEAAAASAAAAEAAAASSATAAANSAALVNAPADTAIAAAINGTGTATKTALNATIGTVSAPAPSGGDDTAALQALIDAGASAVRLQTGGTYNVTSLTAPARQFMLEGIGTTLNATTANPAIVKNGAHKVGLNGVRVVLLSEANKITDAAPAERHVTGSLMVRNDRDAAAPALDVAGFQGQAAGAANNARTVQVHHYNDNDAMWIDNVGAGAALRLNNARNITRRTDKDSTYVGTGVYVTMREMKTDGSSYMELFNINNKAEFTWTGAAGSRVSTAKFTQNKADDGQWAFSFPTTNAHANVASFGSTVEMLSDVSLTRGVIRSHSSKTVGLIVTTAAGALTLGSADGNIYTTGAQFTTSGDTTPVKFNRSINVRNYGTLASALPTLGAGDRSLASAEGKLYFWTGTAWQQVTSA